MFEKETSEQCQFVSRQRRARLRRSKTRAIVLDQRMFDAPYAVMAKLKEVLK